jgi:hypothetical protein
MKKAKHRIKIKPIPGSCEMKYMSVDIEEMKIG